MSLLCYSAGYKTHTDCIVGYHDKRDRYATILVYLQDVQKGGETQFPGKVHDVKIIYYYTSVASIAIYCG